MINSNELRLGNLVWDDYSGIMTITAISKIYVDAHHVKNSVEARYSIESINPLPISKEILERFGFEYVDYGYTQTGEYCGREFKMDFGTNVGTMFINADDYSFGIYGSKDDMGFTPNIIIKSVHQLQNLISALTGEELKFKL